MISSILPIPNSTSSSTALIHTNVDNHSDSHSFSSQTDPFRLAFETSPIHTNTIHHYNTNCNRHLYSGIQQYNSLFIPYHNYINQWNNVQKNNVTPPVDDNHNTVNVAKIKGLHRNHPQRRQHHRHHHNHHRHQHHHQQLHQQQQQQQFQTHNVKSCDLITEDEPKPNFSYIGLIAKAILSTQERRMILSEIYQWIQLRYPYFSTRGPGWRNSIRHNLSLNDCFIKVDGKHTCDKPVLLVPNSIASTNHTTTATTTTTTTNSTTNNINNTHTTTTISTTHATNTIIPLSIPISDHHPFDCQYVNSSCSSLGPLFLRSHPLSTQHPVNVSFNVVNLIDHKLNHNDLDRDSDPTRNHDDDDEGVVVVVTDVNNDATISKMMKSQQYHVHNEGDQKTDLDQNESQVDGDDYEEEEEEEEEIPVELHSTKSIINQSLDQTLSSSNVSYSFHSLDSPLDYTLCK
ncbi:unnamed protein product [Schistosoma mattheei]|uniref:Fork-head domain-containing protein n=2 Tax=Schistosoma mattheei TaxID=31246 RepID=A0AA85AQU1_9TREM|nr:unnamed protein product [Schistosoma mattheei]